MAEARRPNRGRAAPASAFVEGWRRVLGAPALSAGLLAAAVLSALPFVEVLGGSLRAPLLLLRAPVSFPGIAVDWADWVLGLPTLRTFGEGLWTPIGLTAFGGYLLFWTFLSGGVLDRLARGRAVGATAFFAACGTHVLRFVRLGLLVGAAYWGLVVWLRPLVPELVFLALLVAIHVTTDFAKVRLVVEDRRSAIAAWFAAVRFIRRRPLRLLLLAAMHVALLTALMWFWPYGRPPGAAPGGAAILLAVVALLAPLWLRLAVIASEIAFFQSDLAHAGYTAAPWPLWPDSPSAEAMDNFLDQARADASPVRDA